MEIRNFSDGTNWTKYMDKIMVFVAQQKVTIELIERLLREIRLTPGMAKLLESIRIRRLSKIGTQLVIISDANNFFIETVLNNLHPPIIPDEIIANRAIGTRIAHKTGPDNQDEEVTYLKIEAYEDQIDCKMCPKNLCKGKALRNYIQNHGPFGRVFYAGDGRNDICAGMELGLNCNFYDGTNWTEYMDKITVFVAQQKVIIELIESLLREIRLTPGMAKLLESIRIHRLLKIGTQSVIKLRGESFNHGPNNPQVFVVVKCCSHFFAQPACMYIAGKWVSTSILVPVCVSMDDGIKRYEEIIK